jgi:pentatricopeptide repeat protein
VAKQLDNARTLFESMESGEVGVRPGPASYEGFVLACIRSKEWNEVFRAYQTMKEAGVLPSQVAVQGLLLASYHTGDKEQSRSFIEELLSLGVRWNHESCLLAAKILLPEMVDGNIPLEVFHKKIRESMEYERALAESAIPLTRSLHVALTEEEREPSNALPLHEIEKRRTRAWREVLKHLLEYADATKKEKA